MLPASPPVIKTFHVVDVFWPCTGKRVSFRWPTRAKAVASARDFPSGKVTIRTEQGYYPLVGDFILATEGTRP